MKKNQWKALGIGFAVLTVLLFAMGSVEWSIRRPFVIVLVAGLFVCGYLAQKATE